MEEMGKTGNGKNGCVIGGDDGKRTKEKLAFKNDVKKDDGGESTIGGESPIGQGKTIYLLFLFLFFSLNNANLKKKKK